MPKVLVTIPYWETIEPIVAAAATQIALSVGGLPLFVKGRPIDYARNSIVRVFLQNPEYTHLLTLDSDVEPPVNTLKRLLDCNTDLASGCYRLTMPTGFKWPPTTAGMENIICTINSPMTRIHSGPMLAEPDVC